MEFVKKYFIPLSVLYWIIATAFAIEPGYAVFDKYFLVILLAAFVIWFVVAQKVAIRKRTVLLASLISLFIVIVSFVFLLGIVYKQIQVEESSNPFEYLDGGTGTAIYVVTFLDWPYWMPQKIQEYHLSKVAPDRLIKFSQNDLYLRIRGVDESVVIEAFGEPTSIRTDGIYEVWEYHPWDNHPNWIMPVYIQDSKLWSIGDIDE